MEHLSKGNYIWSSVINDELVRLQKYLEEFIFPLKHHTQIIEPGVQDIGTCSATGKSKEDASNHVSLLPIKIAHINCEIL